MRGVHLVLFSGAVLALVACGVTRPSVQSDPASSATSAAPAAAVGSAWQLVRASPVAVDSDRELLSVTYAAFDSETHGVALLFPADIVVTEDGGSTWRLAERPLTNGALGSLEILGASIWTSGGDSLRRSSDGGRTWRELPYYGSIYGSSNFFSFVDQAVGWYAIGMRSGTAPVLSATRDGGVTWTPVPAPAEAQDAIVGVSLLPDEGLLLLASGDILTTRDGGVSWSAIALPIGDRRLPRENLGVSIDAIRFVDGRNGTVVLYFERPRGFVVFQTSDGGATWQEEQLPAEGRPALGNVFLSRDRKLLTITSLETGRVHLYRRN